MLLEVIRYTYLHKFAQPPSPNISKSFSHLIRTFSTQIPLSKSPPFLKPLNSRISGYMRNGQVDEAQDLFDEMPQRNTVSWNAMIRGYFQNAKPQKALNLFRTMPERDIYTYNTVISGLMQCGDVGGAMEVFDGMVVRDVVTWNSVIAGYIHEGFIDEGVRMFERMPLEMRNVISWNLIIGGLVNNGQVDLAKEYFRQTSDRDVVSWKIMVSGFARVGRIVEAHELFQQMPVKDVQVWNALMVGYMENEGIDMAEMLFQGMPEQDLNSWKQLIHGLLNSQRVNDAIRIFMEMPQKCQKTLNSILLRLIRNGHIKAAHAFIEKQPYGNVVSWTNIIIGYFGQGETGSAIRLFELMPSRDTTVWNVMICGLGENGHGEEGLKFFVQMKGLGPSPDKATFTSVLTICSDLSTLCLGVQIHAQGIVTGFDQVIPVSNALITMYARCGNVHSAMLVFSSMPSHNVISWNSVICGFAHHGFSEQALELFEHMTSTDIKPNHITFVGVLFACSHAGLVEQGTYYFNYMRNKYLLQPTNEHYTCLIDLLGRFGLINEATTLLNQLRMDGIEVPASVWGALLGACRIHRNIELGEIAAERVLEIEPDKSGVYLVLAEMYLSVGRREDAKIILTRMKEKGVKKQPGCSWIEVNNNGHVFLSGDHSHYEFSRICCLLDLLKVDKETAISKPGIYCFEQFQASFD